MAEDTNTEAQGICPHLNASCKGELGGVIIDLCSDWLAAHGTDLDEERGNDAVRDVLQKLLNNLPTAEKFRENEKLMAQAGGNVADA